MANQRMAIARVAARVHIAPKSFTRRCEPVNVGRDVRVWGLRRRPKGKFVRASWTASAGTLRQIGGPDIRHSKHRLARLFLADFREKRLKQPGRQGALRQFWQF